jgi:hypothetical protein
VSSIVNLLLCFLFLFISPAFLISSHSSLLIFPVTLLSLCFYAILRCFFPFLYMSFLSRLLRSIFLLFLFITFFFHNHCLYICFFLYLTISLLLCVIIATYSGLSIHDGTLFHSKSQYTTVKHSRKLLEHTYTSDPHGLGTLTPIEFFQQYLLWQSSNTHSHFCSQKASKHTSGQSIVGLSIRLHTTTAPRRIVHH